MKRSGLVTRLRMLIPGPGPATAPALEGAWSAWERGEIAAAHTLAREALALRNGFDEARHLLFLIAFVGGDYRAALDRYRSIGPQYRRLGELTGLVIDAFVHLGAIAEALQFARGRKDVAASTLQRLEDHVRRPLEVDLERTAIVPFADHPLTEYFPAFAAEINGHRSRRTSIAAACSWSWGPTARPRSASGRSRLEAPAPTST
jgi:hypothetical protein